METSPCSHAARNVCHRPLPQNKTIINSRSIIRNYGFNEADHPCLDLKDGRVVKGTHFVGLQDAGDPVELARRYNEQGADEVVFLDITATREDRGTIIDVVQRAADQLFLPLTVGGGIRSIEDMKQILRAGADKVSINSSAVKDPDLITKGAGRFGTQCIVVAIDVRRNYDMAPGRTPITLADGRECWYEVVTHGGSRPTGLDAVKWAMEAEERGAGEILLTSMETDGTREGFDIPITRARLGISRDPGHRKRRRGFARKTSTKVSQKERPTPAWRQASSITASSPFVR